jgi:hypothetical protein
VTSHSGWHLGHAHARERDGRVVLPTWSVTSETHVQNVGDVHVVRYSRQFGGSSKNHPTLWTVGFAEFVPQNSMVAVLDGIGGVMWHRSEGCVTAKQLRVERVGVGSKT